MAVSVDSPPEPTAQRSDSASSLQAGSEDALPLSSVAEAAQDVGHQGREAELIVTAFRTLVLLLALTAPRILGVTGSYDMPEIWLAGLAGVYNIIAGLSYLHPGRYGMRRGLMVAMDMMLITLWIRVSGQWELFPFYFLVVVVAAMWFQVLGGALAAAFCNFLFLFMWARAAGDPDLLQAPVFTTSMALGTLLLFLVGTLVGYIAEIQDREREQRLENQLLVANYQREIDISSQLQPLLLSGHQRLAPALEIGVGTKPARKLGGGDYVDAIALSKSKTLLCIADVSGKSVRAQARLPLLKYSLRALAPLYPEPAELVTRLNQTLAPDLQSELYIAFCCVLIDTKAKVLRWCNAGHIAPLLVRRKDGDSSVFPLETLGPPLGIFPETEYPSRQKSWDETSRLLLYTDGLSDALSYNNTEDGEAQVQRLGLRLVQDTERSAHEAAEEFIDLAKAALEASEEFPERLRMGIAERLSALRPAAFLDETSLQERPAPPRTKNLRDDITVVVVRAKPKSRNQKPE